LSLYLVTDPELVGDRALEDVVDQAVEGGVTCVQVREKQASTRAFVERARSIQDLLAGRDVPLIINDRVDVALAVAADGVHVGQDDMPYPEARALLGPDAIIGVSVETMDDVDRAETYDVDYLGVSPIFETPTKRDTRGAWGLEGLARVRTRSRHRLVVIGGLNSTNAAAAIAAGADGIAVVSAICAAPDPRRVAADLRHQIDTAHRQRANAGDRTTTR
jgi:thiamine-phosphate pyrophosphorylase